MSHSESQQNKSNLMVSRGLLGSVLEAGILEFLGGSSDLERVRVGRALAGDKVEAVGASGLAIESDGNLTRCTSAGVCLHGKKTKQI